MSEEVVELRLVDTLIPRAAAEGALRTYDRYMQSQDDPVYAFQRAFLEACEAAGYHRHLRGRVHA